MNSLPPTTTFGLDPEGFSIAGQSAGPVQEHLQMDPFARQRPADEQVRNASIMIVDDDASAAFAVRKFLTESGFRNIIPVGDEARAIDQIGQSKPDLVLLNVSKQGNGMDVLRTMRAHEYMQRIPVITMTGNTDAAMRIEALGLGADDFLTRPVDMGELVARVRNSLCRKLDRDQLARYSSELEVDVLRDSLTGIANRRAFDYEINRRMTEWARQRTPSAFLLVDIDRFKDVNDRLGHQQGDRVLQSVASLIEDAVRGMDLVARYGGEEFAVIMPGSTFEESIIVGERIRRTVESARFEAGGQGFRITVSVGATESMEKDTVQTLFERADKALYEAKNSGRNRCLGYDGREFRTHAAGESSRTRDEARVRLNRTEATAQSSRILIVDDDPLTAQTVRGMLNEAGYFGVKAVSGPEKAFEKIRSIMPDLVLCNIQMQGVTGADILTRLREHPDTQNVRVAFLVSASDEKVKQKCLALGATDYLNKPVNSSELIARVQDTLIAKAHVTYLADESNRVGREIRQRTSELLASRNEAIQCLARAIDKQTNQSGLHAYRVGRYAAIIARELGFDHERCVLLEYAAQLHDVGKLCFPDKIHKNADELTSEEYELMKRHCIAGRKIILDEPATANTRETRSIQNNASSLIRNNSPIMKMAALVAESHHELWDGTGYPCGLQNKSIPIEGRIVAVADVFDAISSRRPYRDAIELDDCFRIIEASAGSQFDPAVVDAFLKRKPDVLAVYLEHRDNA